MAPLPTGPDQTVIRAVRRARNLSQASLAEAAQVERSYLSRVERLDRKPSARILKRLAAALGAEPNDLLRNPQELV